MKTHTLFEGRSHKWLMFGRDPAKPEKIIDTNQYMVVTSSNALLMDPGGIELFSSMLTTVIKQVPVDKITHLFASHQDPDIISSLGLWDQALDGATLHSPWIWESFIRHFGMQNINYNAIPDDGGNLKIDDVTLEFVPAHYLHSSGNFNVFDPQTGILMSGDIGAAMDVDEAPMFVDDFESHVPRMKLFHQRWMPSNEAKRDWVERVRKLNVKMICPQHGRIFKDENVDRFLDWFDALEVGLTGQKLRG